MARLRGTGLGAGMAMGTAAVVHVRGGAAVMPDPPARIASLVAHRRLTEVPDIVVVAEEFKTALAIANALSWAKVVGIAAERSDPDTPIPAVPAVTGLSGLMTAVTDDVLVLVDATRGIVLVDPDPIYLAQYTAEHDRVAPKNRLYLDEAHLPAATLDGHGISVAVATDGLNLEEALASGPDALYHTLPLTFDPDELRNHLAQVTAVAAGKPLIVPYNASLPLAPLLEAASVSDLTIAVPLVKGVGDTGFGQSEIGRVAEEIMLVQRECEERDILTGTPRLSAELVFREPDAWPTEESIGPLLESVAAQGATRLIFYGQPKGPLMGRLAEIVAVASINLLPVTFYIDDTTLRLDASEIDRVEYANHLRLLIGAGVSGFLVSVDLVRSTKNLIRESSVSECRGELSRHLSAS